MLNTQEKFCHRKSHAKIELCVRLLRRSIRYTDIAAVLFAKAVMAEQSELTPSRRLDQPAAYSTPKDCLNQILPAGMISSARVPVRRRAYP